MWDSRGSPAVASIAVARFLIRSSVSESVDHPNRLVCQPTRFCAWPPNLFAFTSAFLDITGCYARITNLNDRTQDFPEYPRNARRIADEWKRELDKYEEAAFSFLSTDDSAAWERGFHLLGTELRLEIERVWSAFQARMRDEDDEQEGDIQLMWRNDHRWVVDHLLLLHGIADEVCAGWGIRKLEGQPRAAARIATERLEQFGTLATIHPDRGRVLPKRHSPRIGTTLRSLSTSLCFHRSSIKVEWHTNGPTLLDVQEHKIIKSASLVAKKQDLDIAELSVLLCPWPLRVFATDFVSQPLKRHEPEYGDIPPEGYFSYAPKSKTLEELEHLRTLVTDAQKEGGKIDLVILPEAALSRDELDGFENLLRDLRVGAFITGVRGSDSGDEADYTTNEVVFRSLGKDNTMACRPKHHRWLLERSQIQQYHLGSRLHPSYEWWESIVIGRRRLSFINLGSHLTVCPLICEDLARQEPVSELIRAVGPSLVVAILLDGPQVKGRWAARYASVLGDDPGSSVITLTCAGMVDRCASPDFPKSRVIGLWSDRTGRKQEIHLDRAAKAVLLSLAVAPIRQCTQDRRIPSSGTYTLTLAGVHQLRIDDRKQ